jgi:hypothetical protein
MVFNAAVGPGECAGSATGSVVCQNFSHGYAAFSEPCAGPSPKRCGCLFAFISQQFGACQPGRPVDRGAQIAGAADRIAVHGKHSITLVGEGVAVAHRAAQQPPATAGGEPCPTS